MRNLLTRPETVIFTTVGVTSSVNSSQNNEAIGLRRCLMRAKGVTSFNSIWFTGVTVEDGLSENEVIPRVGFSL